MGVGLSDTVVLGVDDDDVDDGTVEALDAGSGLSSIVTFHHLATS